MKMKKHFLISLLLVMLLALSGFSASAEEKPGWYPPEGSSFVPFHDPDADRIVDNANILTEDGKTEMYRRIQAAAQYYGIDLVIYTDDQDYGIRHDALVEDFFDYNGYGLGDDYSGFCLFICMKPGDRDWWTTATGKAEALLTEEHLNQIDDLMEPYMISGDYDRAVRLWLAGTYLLSGFGRVYVPDWYPSLEEQAVFTRFQDTEGDKVIDLTGTLDDAGKTAVESQLKTLSGKNAMDIRILFTESCSEMSGYEYAKLYYTYKGLGTGANYDGLLAVCNTKSGYTYLYGEGTGAKLVGTDKGERLESALESVLKGQGAESTGLKYAKLLSFYFRFKTIPHSLTQWGGLFGFSMIPGLIFGSIRKNKAAARMRTVRSAYNANAHLVKNSYQVIYERDIFLNRTEETKYSPRPKESFSGGSSGSSGRSTYHSSHSGSSGRSHTTGGGRKF